MYLFFFFLNQICVLRITTAVFSFSLSVGRAAATALHDQIQLWGRGCSAGFAAGAAEHKRAEAKSENFFTLWEITYFMKRLQI